MRPALPPGEPESLWLWEAHAAPGRGRSGGRSGHVCSIAREPAPGPPLHAGTSSVERPAAHPWHGLGAAARATRPTLRATLIWRPSRVPRAAIWRWPRPRPAGRPDARLASRRPGACHAASRVSHVREGKALWRLVRSPWRQPRHAGRALATTCMRLAASLWPRRGARADANMCWPCWPGLVPASASLPARAVACCIGAEAAAHAHAPWPQAAASPSPPRTRSLAPPFSRTAPPFSSPRPSPARSAVSPFPCQRLAADWGLLWGDWEPPFWHLLQFSDRSSTTAVPQQRAVSACHVRAQQPWRPATPRRAAVACAAA